MSGAKNTPEIMAKMMPTPLESPCVPDCVRVIDVAANARQAKVTVPARVYTTRPVIAVAGVLTPNATDPSRAIITTPMVVINKAMAKRAATNDGSGSGVPRESLEHAMLADLDHFGQECDERGVDDGVGHETADVERAQIGRFAGVADLDGSVAAHGGGAEQCRRAEVERHRHDDAQRDGGPGVDGGEQVVAGLA